MKNNTGKPYYRIFFRNTLIFGICSCILNMTYTLSNAEDQIHPLSYYDVIEERNIFRPNNDLTSDRSDISSTIVTRQQEENSSAVKNISLTGIIRIRGRYKAIIEKKDEQSGFYVSQGDEIDQYTVEEIKDDQIKLIKDGKSTVLKINIQRERNEKDSDSGEKDMLIEIDQDQKSNEEPKENFRSNIIRNIRTGGLNE